MTLLVLLWGGLVGCAPATPEPAPPPRVVAVPASTPQRSAPPARTSDPVAQHVEAAETLELGPAEVLHEGHGLRLERRPWRLGEEQGVAVRVQLPRSATLHVEPAGAVTPFQQLLPDDPGPWAAVNGGFYDVEGRPMGLVVTGGVERHPRGRSGSGIVEAGPHPLRVVHRDAWGPGAQTALQSIDRLVDQGRSLVRRREGARRTARSAVAVGDGAVWLVVAYARDSVDEATPEGVHLRATAFRGLPLWAFAELLVRGGATQALNLDGAVSTQLVVATPTWRHAVHGEAGTVQAVVLRP